MFKDSNEIGLMMKFIYLDEAGNTGRKVDTNQPYHMLAAVIVDAEKVRSVESDMRALAGKYFDINGKIGAIEFHGYEISSGKGPFKGMKPEVRIEIMKEAIATIKNNELLLGHIVIDKARNSSSKHPHELAFLFMVERVQDYLEVSNCLGLLIADENDDVEQRLIENLDNYKITNTSWGYRPTKINNIIDSVHFVASKNNWLIQLADIVAYVLLRGMRTRSALIQQYIASKPPDLGFSSWIEQKASVSQKIDLELYNSLRALQFRFTKEYP
jgi:hypothetical protein